jgi:hypothetical protein
MKKLIPLQLIIAFICIHSAGAYAQDSVKKAKLPATAIINYKGHGPIDLKDPPINKLVQNVRYAYYRDKTDAQVAAIIYANKASYNAMLDKIYNDYDVKKGISRATFDRGISKKYGDPFPSVKPLTYVPPVPVKPVPVVVDTSKHAMVTPVPAASSEKSLNGQYQYLLTKVYNYQQPLISAFHKNVMDTLNQVRAALKKAKDKVTVQGKTIDSLQTASKSADQTVSDANNKLNEIDLLGVPMAKATYNLIMWGLVILFGVIAVIVIARSGAHSSEAKYRTQLYNELDEEYKAYKVKANEKEKKLARELQTERNKLDDLLGSK